MPVKILIVDDEENIIRSLKRMLQKEGYTIFSARNGTDGLSVVVDEEIEVALVDYQMPGMNGLQLLKKIKRKSPSTEVIIITGYGTIQSAVEAMKLGAYDYITKPLNSIELRKTLKTVLEKKHLISENRRLQAELETKYSFQGIIGISSSMEEVFRTMAKASMTDSSVMIQGESGTGKELVARSIHYNSVRADKPFVTIDCSSISIQVIESELFGHVKGAFTGAHSDKKGLLKDADSGTVFIDEITEIPLETQAKFLRVLQEKEIRPVGSNREGPLDIRVIAATNKKIQQEVESGNFRLDLFYRLNVVPIYIPPLRDRRDDIPLFIDHFMNEFRDRKGKFESISNEAVSILINYRWPGNVRELRNIIERIFVLGSGSFIEVHHLPSEIVETVHTFTPKISQGRTLNELEKEAIITALEMSDSNCIKASKILGIGKSTFYRKLKQYNIEL